MKHHGINGQKHAKPQKEVLFSAEAGCRVFIGATSEDVKLSLVQNIIIV